MESEMRTADVPIQTPDFRQLAENELAAVNGGFIWIAAFVIGAAVGYGCRKAGDAAVDWAFGDDEG
jgi:bacteriocin-like protein